MRHRRLWRTGIFPVLFFFLSIQLFAAALPAQTLVRAWRPWRTVETRRFVFHYPTDLEQWTLALASRADAIDSAVARIVGYAPGAKTHVVVDDPYALPNGSAWPFINQPVINLWASPPDPRLDIGEYRDWGRTLLAHELGHIVHLSRPSRNPVMRRLWQLGPADLGPITLDAPRWVIEGYATYVEGIVTGSGRPHGSWRPAYLRQWAIEGQLPRYEQLDAWGAYEGGEFAYLAGSAFLEWLAERRGDSSLVAVWRRMTAKQRRGFDESFSGVFGESARTLYGRFAAELTGKALEIERAARAAFPGDTGAVVQRLAWSTGDPTISSDGKRIAIALSSATAPSRIVIWSTAAEPDTGRARRDSLLRKSDPEDVPARPIHPPPKKVLATLRATNGAAYESPRFLPDGRVLVSRFMRVGDGSLRPDLSIWDPARKTVHRVTHGASVRHADPRPDGRSALAMRCRSGWCDVVSVDMATGADSVVLRGSPERSYFRPRWSPDGTRFAVARNDDAANGRWKVIVVDALTGRTDELPFAGNAYDATWLDAGTIVATTDGDGIPNLQRIDLATRVIRTLTHVTGAAVAAERNPADSTLWFLSLYSRGYDLRRIPAVGSSQPFTIAVQPALAPAALAPPKSAPVLGTNGVSPPRPFGLGDRALRWFPLPNADADGYSGALVVASTDLIGRSEVLAKIAAGDRAAWHGGALEATWRGSRPFIRLSAFDAMQSLSVSRSSISPLPGNRGADVRMRGALAMVDLTHVVEAWSARARAGASASAIGDESSTTRTLLFGDIALGWSQRFAGTSSLAESFSASGTAGRSFDRRFHRTVVSAATTASGFTPYSVSASATFARTSDDAPGLERLSLGGGQSPLVDRVLLAQRVPQPALPAGVASYGTKAFVYRVTINARLLSPYFWSGSTAPPGGGLTEWHRVVGLEGAQTVPAIPVAGVPAARAVYGAGESLDEPRRHKLAVYVGFIVNP